MVNIEAVAKDVVDCAIKVPKTLGPGLLESAYQYCHAYELRKRGWIAEVESIPPVHEAQLLTYRKLTDCKIGFLLNWNVTLMKNGIKRFVLNLPRGRPLPEKTFCFYLKILRAL